MKYSYQFPAIRGIQAGREFYSFMCPLGIIHKLFVFDSDDVPPEYRAQRVLNKKRVPEIANYMVENPQDYVFSSLTASIDGEHYFEPASTEETLSDVGTLNIDMESKLIINDGQHRRAAIEEAIRMNPILKDENISIVLFKDEDLTRCQQMFSDLNQHAVNVSKSIGILYDHRDPRALLTKELVKSSSNFKKYTDMSNTTLAQRSSKLFTLSNIHKTNERLLRGLNYEDPIIKEFTFEFWSFLLENFKEWQTVFAGESTPYYSRQASVASYGTVIEALGIIGNFLYSNHPENWKNSLIEINNVNWSRTNLDTWQYRCIDANGKIRKNQTAILLTVNQIKATLDLSLSPKEEQAEKEFNRKE